MRDVLVAVEIALAVMLLGSAGLMGKSLSACSPPTRASAPRGSLGIELSVAEPGARPVPGALVALEAHVQDAVEAIPGVSRAARVNRMPGTGSGGSHSFVRPDRPRPTRARAGGVLPGGQPGLLPHPGHSPARGAGLRAGGHPRPSAPVVIVNRALQSGTFPGEDAIGKTIRPVYSDTERR